MKSATELRMPPDLRKVLDEAVERIVEIADPQAVILFGSHAEGRSHPHSDFDLMVIVDAENTRQIESDLYRVMDGLPEDPQQDVPPFDIIVMTPEEWEHEALLPGLVCFRARRHGVVLHGEAA
jgi:predicted nucleotidyltransferase